MRRVELTSEISLGFVAMALAVNCAVAVRSWAMVHGHGREAEGFCVNLGTQRVGSGGWGESKHRTPLRGKILPGISLPGGSLALFSPLSLCHLALLVS